MKLLVATDGMLLAAAEEDQWGRKPAGATVEDAALDWPAIEAATREAAGLGGPRAVAYDHATGRLTARARALSGDEAARKAARDTILVTAQGAVGKAVATLTTAERNALLTVLLWGAGAVRPDLTVAPLAEWARATPRDG